MREDLLSILAAAARKLLVVRSVESAAIGAVAAGLGAAACEAAWAVAWVSLPAAAAFCVVPVLAAVGLAVSGRMRRALRLSDAVAWPAAGVCGLAGLAGMLAVLAGLYADVPRWALPLMLVPAGALVGAVAAAVRGVSLGQAAVFHDVRLHLEERLSTAAELARSARRDDPFARCVYAQALRAAREGQVGGHAGWRRTRATAGALGLSIVLCAAVALLPTWGPADIERSFEQIRARAADLRPAKRKELIETLRQLAELAEKNPALRERLIEAAEAAAKDEDLAGKLGQVEEALAGADVAEAARIARKLLGATSPDGPSGGSKGAATAPSHPGAGRKPPAIPDANSIVGDGVEKPLVARVFVYDKSYRDVADANGPAPAGRKGGQDATFLRLDDAWRAARDRASAALAAGSVPAEYRGLVRRFFELR